MTSELPAANNETYLGDGVYASFDGWHAWLRTRREGGDHVIALEPKVYQALLRWIASYPRLQQHMNE